MFTWLFVGLIGGFGLLFGWGVAGFVVLLALLFRILFSGLWLFSLV